MRTISLSLLWLALLSAADAAQIYNSPADDGVPGPAASIPIDGTPVLLNLYIDDGPANSAPADKCTGNGGGDEICGYDAVIATTGAVTIDAFTPAAGVLASFDEQTLKANAVDAIAPVAGPKRIGTLTVSALANGEIRVIGKISVRSDLVASPIDQAILGITGLDTDGDGVRDSEDNCTEVANADQRDTNDDGFGNICDADINNDLAINFADLNIMKDKFFTTSSSPGWDPDVDLNGDDAVNFADLNIVKNTFFGMPGPSGVVQ